MRHLPPSSSRSRPGRANRLGRLRRLLGLGGVLGGGWHVWSAASVRSTESTSLFRRICSLGDFAGGVDAATAVAHQAASAVGGLFGSLLDLGGSMLAAANEVGGMCWATIATLIFIAALRQARVHLVATNLQRSLEHLPGDRCVHVSPGIPLSRVFHVTAEGHCCSVQRLWYAIRMESWRSGLHPISVAKQYIAVSVASASVHDLRRYLDHARRSWLSTEEISLLTDVQRRVFDSLSFRDCGGDGGDGNDDPIAPTPVDSGRRPRSTETM